MTGVLKCKKMFFNCIFYSVGSVTITT